MTEQTKTETTKTQLVVIEPATTTALFTEGDGVDALLADIRQKATSLVPDTTTAKGRKEIASIAHSVAKAKTYIDGFGKELADKYKDIPKRIDANRKKFRDALDALKDEVRAPLTRYEEAETARVAALQDRLAFFVEIKQLTAELPSAELERQLQQIESIAIDDSWQEITAQAGIAKDAAVLHLRTVIEKAKAREEQAAELERLRQEAADREKEDRERQIAAQAAAAEAQRQEQARLDAERREREAKVREEQAIRDAEAAELARQQAEARSIAEAEQAEQRRLQAEAEAKRQAEEAAARATEQERQRIAQEQARKQWEEEQRIANVEHRRAVNNSILMDLMGLGIEETQAINLIKHIASNNIAHLAINY